MTDSFGFSTSITTERMPDPGLFTWDLSSDLVYADSAVASLFGLKRVAPNQIRDFQIS